ncbi:polysaccharide pyruvyl transferase family protein [Priestia filamentosa]|uniref:General stress protein n=1 Tax=Priestia filamentosa TaxID=1402861 RepID=A0A231S4K3_9BACI|nr:polysaccharide pyruvyl transferase family protein [Priestia filamentosa]AKO94924.1 general stress protein [Priestia filamentosa]AVD54471.1 general stress protein [Priestia filamentosa]MDT3765729.1 polysaccharide pyruvyl transferase family protein [Priestia filamentosa]OXS66344.1 general stress protein [Priestia filamentosa]RJS67537.1 general stress protein [Priestia filamentosa]
MSKQTILNKELPKGVGPNVSPEAFTNDKRKVFLFGSPSYTNIGDQAIAYAEEKFIRNHYPYYEYIEIMDYATDEGIQIVKEIISEDDIVCFTGGGNLGNLYLDIEEDRRKVISTFKDYKTLSFAQSVYFEETEEGDKEKKKTKDAYHQNRHLTIGTREQQTLEYVKDTFDSEVMYTPDMVLSLDIEPQELEREGVLFILREDKEKVTEEKFISELREWIEQEKGKRTGRTDTVLHDIDVIDYKDREDQFMKMLNRIGSSELIVTDRLHAMIFSIITKTPCVVFGNSYGKAKHSYRDWLEALNFIEYTDQKDINKLEEMIDRLLQAEPNDIDLKEDFRPLRTYFKK